MEPFQPFLVALLAVLVAVSVPLLIRKVRERRDRGREQAIIATAAPRVQHRLAAIGDPSIPPEPDTPYIPYAVLAAIARSAAVANAAVTRRRVWRDASAALVVFAGIGLIAVFALPAVGQPAPPPSALPTEAAALASVPPTAVPTQAAIALAPSPLPTRVEIALPTAEPTPTLPVTATPKPTQQTRIAAATPKPTAKPKPKATPKPTPKPTPIPDPIARFSCTFQGGLTVAFDSTSRYAKSYAWDFQDGASSAADPTHVFSGSGAYRVSLTVTNASGSDTATKLIDLDAGTGCS
jgi:hypothetical protein